MIDHAKIAPPQTLALWVPPSVPRVDALGFPVQDRIERQLKPMLARVQRDLRGATCDYGSLNLSLVTLAAMGLDLSPAAQECAIVPYKGVCSPIVMRAGLRRLAAEMWPITSILPQVVLLGDEWDYRIEDGEHVTWRPGKERATVARAQGGLNYAGIVAAFCQVSFQGDLPTITGVLHGDELHEKLRANRSTSNAKSGSGWGLHPLAMIEKTAEKYTLKVRMPLRGRPAAAMAWDSLAEARRLPELAQTLRDDAEARGLPDEAQDIIDVDVNASEPVGDDELDELRKQWEAP